MSVISDDWLGGGDLRPAAQLAVGSVSNMSAISAIWGLFALFWPLSALMLDRSAATATATGAPRPMSRRRLAEATA
ncbi:hypothetical protein C5B97_02875 [Pseudoclavibacter sp. RFBB5]|nr:hypothetical protein C5B97_02875 [Pseudoclavibacter sp. RFBB5]